MTPSELIHFEIQLEEYLRSNDPAPRLWEAMRYASFSGGKRIRPQLVFLTAQLAGLEPEQVLSIACAIELLHTYSLIHDDLPAMDDDDLRRGKPSCHKQFDEATAILAGDALQSLAFHILAEDSSIPAEKRCELLADLAQVIGPFGMAAGQQLDLQHMHPDSAMRAQIAHLKTGCLILACVILPLSLTAPEPQRDQAMLDFGHQLGLAFQLQDDALDQEGTQAAADEAYREALDLLAPLGEPASTLIAWVKKLSQRTR